MKYRQIFSAITLATSLSLAQQTPAPSQVPDGWRKMSDFNDNQSAPSTPAANSPLTRRSYSPQLIPDALTVPAGTYFTIRTTQPLSSNQNHPGDQFTATLVKPIIANGRVVADRGEIVVGRVVESLKAGKVKGQSKLAITLTDLTLVDGSQIPFHAQLTGFTGGTSYGRDTGTIVGPAATGAAIGGIAAGPVGAGIGAAAGATAGLIGVLFTRGNPTVIYPESVLTFRLEDPIQVATARAPQAFRIVGSNDYEQPYDQPRTLVVRPPIAYAAPYYGYYGPSLTVGLGSIWGPGYYRPAYRYGYGYRGGGYGRHRYP